MYQSSLGPLEEQLVRLAARVHLGEARLRLSGRGRIQLRRGGTQRVHRLVHEAAIGLQVVAQHVAFDDVAALLDAHVAARVDFLEGLVIAHPVGRKRLSAAAQAHRALGLRFPLGVTLYAVGFDEKGKLVRLGRKQHEIRLPLKLQPFLGGAAQRQRAQHGERDARYSELMHRGEACGAKC